LAKSKKVILRITFFKNPWKILAFAEPDPPQDGEGEAEKSEKEKMRYVLVKIRTYFQENPSADF